MESVLITNITFREQESFLKHFSDGPKREKGQLFLQIDLPDKPGAEDALAEKVWRALHDSFFNNSSDNQYFCFEEALKAVNSVLDTENKKRETGTIGRLNGIASLLDGHSLHFAQTGHAIVSLKRAKYFSRISEETDPEEAFGFHTISSGDLSKGDRIIMSSRNLPFDTETLFETFNHKPSKSSQQVKALAKKKELFGIISFYDVELPEKPKEELKERNVPLPEKPKNVTASSKKIFRNKIPQKFLGAVKKGLKTPQFLKAKKTIRGVFDGVSGRLLKIAKKPNRIQEVNRRYILIAVILLFAALGVLLTIQSKYQRQADEEKHYTELLANADNAISIAENRFLIGETSDATEFLNKAATSVDEIAAAGFFHNDVSKLRNQIAAFRDHFDKIIRVSEPRVLADASVKGASDAVGIIHTSDQKNFLFESKTLYESVLDKVQEPLEIDPEEVIIAGAELEDFNVLSFITLSGQVVEYSVRNGRFERVGTLDETWKKGIAISTYNGEFAYILDPSSSTIWKYRRLRNGYGRSSAYNLEGDLTDAISIAIDGEVYVLLRDGTILKYLKGKLQDFNLTTGPSEPLKNPTKIFTHSDASNLYILDSQNKRVVIYSKGSQGRSTYQKQIVFDNFTSNEIRDLSIDREEQKLLIMTKDKVYITDL